MDPYAKALKISTTGHILAVGAVLVAIGWGELFKPQQTRVFTLKGPPAGLIAGGDLGNSIRAADPTPATGAKIPAPAPAEKIAPTEISSAIPSSETFAPPPPKVVRPVVAKKATPKAKAKPAQKLSYSDYQKKFAAKNKTSAKPTTTAKRVSNNPAIPNSSPSFEESLSNRLSRNVSSNTSSSNIGTGSGGAAGSGVMGNGTPGATEDLEDLYTGTVWTYLNNMWVEPKGLGGIHMQARTEFTVDKTGRITRWRITSGSGSAEFDKSVEALFSRIKEVSAPPTPTDYRLSVVFETREQ